MSKQSKLGQELNRIMRESGMTPLQTMSKYLENHALKPGEHTFASKANPSQGDGE